MIAHVPQTRADRQITLLEQALTQRAGLWEGLLLAATDLDAALALAGDVPIQQVPRARGRQWLARFAADPQEYGALAVPPQEYWLTRVAPGYWPRSLESRMRLATARLPEPAE